MKWRPISEYRLEMGRVIVWLRWPQYSSTASALMSEGMFEQAYLMPLNKGTVWVQAKDCIPIETTGRVVSHFMQPTAPSGGTVDG